MAQKNPIAQRLEILADQWAEFATREDARLLRWMLRSDEVRMVVAFLAVWKAELVNNSWALPFITFGAWLFSLGVAFISNRFMHHEQKQRGSFLFQVLILPIFIFITVPIS